MHKIGLGGGCHWCTEGVFASLKGINKVEQGWLCSTSPHERFSEGIIVHFDPNIINIEILVTIHLETHAATNEHSFRKKYRSAVYTYGEQQKNLVETIIQKLQNDYEDDIITLVLPFDSFKENTEQFSNYYFSKPEAPFCRNYITPKLKKL